MYNGGDAAEQIVRLSLEGFQVAAKITGEAAKNIALLLISVLKQEKKTKGKARLTNMIKSGKELKVFSVERKDLSKFLSQAKKYGVLYIGLFPPLPCILFFAFLHLRQFAQHCFLRCGNVQQYHRKVKSPYGV